MDDDINPQFLNANERAIRNAFDLFQSGNKSSLSDNEIKSIIHFAKRLKIHGDDLFGEDADEFSEQAANYLSQKFQYLCQIAFNIAKPGFSDMHLTKLGDSVAIPYHKGSPFQKNASLLLSLEHALQNYEWATHRGTFYNSPEMNPLLDESPSEDPRNSFHQHYFDMSHTSTDIKNNFQYEGAAQMKAKILALEAAWQSNRFDEQQGRRFQELNGQARILINDDAGKHAVYLEPYFDATGKIKFIKYDSNEDEYYTQQQANASMLMHLKRNLGNNDPFFDDRFTSAFAQGGKFPKECSDNSSFIGIEHCKNTTAYPQLENSLLLVKRGNCNSLQQGYKNIRRFLTGWDSITRTNRLGNDKLADVLFPRYIDRRKHILMWRDFLPGEEQRQQFAHNHLLKYRQDFINNNIVHIDHEPLSFHESPVVMDLTSDDDADNVLEHYVPHPSGSGFMPRNKKFRYKWRRHFM